MGLAQAWGCRFVRSDYFSFVLVLFVPQLAFALVTLLSGGLLHYGYSCFGLALAVPSSPLYIYYVCFCVASWDSACFLCHFRLRR